MKRYLITGASRGIGRAIAEKLASAGDCRLLHGRDREALASSCKIVAAKGATAISLCYDLRDPAAIQKMIAEIGTEPLDGLVNNAGIAFVKPLEGITLEEWQTTLAVNVTAPFLLTRDAALAMRLSQIVALIMLFAAGFVLGRHAGHRHPFRIGLAMSVLGALLIAAVKALGG